MEHSGSSKTKIKIKHKIVNIFSYPSILAFVLDAPKNHRIGTVLLSTPNMCFS